MKSVPNFFCPCINTLDKAYCNTCELYKVHCHEQEVKVPGLLKTSRAKGMIFLILGSQEVIDFQYKPVTACF